MNQSTTRAIGSPLRVLLTYGWCRTAYVAAECIARAGHTVFVCDSSALSMARVSRSVKGFFRVPSFHAEPDNYVDALGAIAGRHDIQVLMPMHEDALTVQERRERLPPGLIVAAPPCEGLALGLDKQRIVALAARAGVDAPATAAPESMAEAQERIQTSRFPLVVKTRHGNGGKGVAVARSPAEALRQYRAFVDRFKLGRGRLPLLQEFVPGELCGAAFFSVAGDMKACFAERYLRCKDHGFGTSVLREPVQDDARIKRATGIMCTALGWSGLGHFDYLFCRETGRLALIEMNPRFWGALNLSIINGFNFPLALLQWHAHGAFDASLFPTARGNRASLWLAGETIACVNELAAGIWAAPVNSLRRIWAAGRRGGFDDLRKRDPLPMLFELLYYAAGYVRSRGSTNPVCAGMCQ